MDVRLDQAGRDEPAADIDRLTRRLARRTETSDETAADRDVEWLRVIGHTAGAKQEIEHDATVCRNVGGGKTGERYARCTVLSDAFQQRRASSASKSRDATIVKAPSAKMARPTSSADCRRPSRPRM
jgi:hypothetical protein